MGITMTSRGTLAFSGSNQNVFLFERYYCNSLAPSQTHTYTCMYTNVHAAMQADTYTHTHA